MNKIFILDREPQELENDIVAWGESAFRAKQIITWVYQKRVDSFSAFSNIPLELRKKLEAHYTLRSMKIKKKELSRLDGTARYNFTTYDGYIISSVFLPKKDRNSICLSTQAGCKVGCGFCATGKMKFKRSLTRGEILEQILQVENDTGRKITGVLFMGMGEPLMNYGNVLSALHAIVDFRQFAIGRRHVTLSTVGIVPMIRKLADEKIGVRLALSLHAPDDGTRRKFIPEKVPFSVVEILKAGLYYSRRNRTTLTVEYILVSGVNDTLQSMAKLVKLIRDCSEPKDEITINLIPCNFTGMKEWSGPTMGHIDRLKMYLEKRGILAIIREPKGADIGAACGQLGV